MEVIQLLRRFDFVVYKNKSSTDAAQVPAASTLTFYRQGATVKTTTTLLPSDPPSERELPVFDIGQFQVGDFVTIGFNGPQFEVTGLVGRSKVRILYTDTSSLQVTSGTRLVGPSVQAYKDATGSQPLTAPYNSDGTTGRFGAYIGAPRFDFTVAGGGVSLRAYLDFEGGPAITALGWLMARDFPSLDAAIAACTDGLETTIALEPLHYNFASTLELPVSKRVRLLGAGRGLTTLTCTDKDQPTVWIKGSWCSLESLTIEGTGQVGSGAGIVIGRLVSDQPSPPDIIRYTKLRDVHVLGSPSWGVDILGWDTPGADANSLSIFGAFTNLTIEANRSDGALRIQRANTTQSFSDSQFLHFNGRAAKLDFSDGCSFHECTFEGAPGANPEAFVEVRDCRTASFTSCWFEEDPLPTPPPDLEKGWFFKGFGARTEGLTMTGCIFNRPTGYRTAAVLLEACPGAVIAGMTTFARVAAEPGQGRDDLELRRLAKGADPSGPDDYHYPDLALIGGAANVNDDDAIRAALTVANETGAEVLKLQLEGQARFFRRGQAAVLPWLSSSARVAQYDAPDRVAGMMFFSQATNRVEYFDGTNWRYISGTIFTPTL